MDHPFEPGHGHSASAAHEHSCAHGGTPDACAHGDIPESCHTSGEAHTCAHSALNLDAPKVNLDRRDEELEDDYRLHRRFDRMGRLVGDQAMSRLMSSHVMVIGLGGVGSMAAEALARSGVGRLTLVDFDRVCVTNTNRQLQAMKGTIGKRKAEVLAERIRLINPQIRVDAVCRFYDAHSSAELLSAGPDFVVDAIDNVTAKLHLLSTCRERSIPVVCSTGAGGRMDPTAIRVADLSRTDIDPLAHILRKALRQRYAFPRKGDFGIQAVYSVEPQSEPVELHYDGGKGFMCVCPGGTNTFHSCESRNVIWGTASWVTGTFGLTCASVVVKALIAGLTPERAPAPG